MKLIFKAEWHAHVTAGIAVLFSVCVQQVFKLIGFVVSPCATMMLFTADAQRKRPKGAVCNCKTEVPGSRQEMLFPSLRDFHRLRKVS